MSRVSGKPYFVCVLWSASARRFYTGITEDPQHRLLRHNEGDSRGTARYRPWVLVFQEQYPDHRSARVRENRLKAKKGGQGFFTLTGRDPSQFRFRASLNRSRAKLGKTWAKNLAKTVSDTPLVFADDVCGVTERGRRVGVAEASGRHRPGHSHTVRHALVVVAKRLQSLPSIPTVWDRDHAPEVEDRPGAGGASRTSRSLRARLSGVNGF